MVLSTRIAVPPKNSRRPIVMIRYSCQQAENADAQLTFQPGRIIPCEMEKAAIANQDAVVRA
jgi:hypothetical protein